MQLIGECATIQQMSTIPLNKPSLCEDEKMTVCSLLDSIDNYAGQDRFESGVFEPVQSVLRAYPQPAIRCETQAADCIARRRWMKEVS